VSAAIHAFAMPKWGLTMEKGTLTAWHKGVGDKVSSGEEVCDVETEKIANGVESPVSGILRRKVASEGDVLPIGALLGIIADASVAEADIDAAVQKFQADYVPPEAVEGAETSQPQLIEVAGRRVRHLVHRGDGDPVVLVHGFGGNLENWLLNHAALCEGGHTVAALDLPGHGESAKDVKSGSLEELSSAVLAYMDAMEFKQAHLVGHSLGGAICLAVARRAPERVRSLTLLAPAGLGQKADGSYIRGFAEATSSKQLKPVMQKLFADPELVTRQLVNDTLKYKRLEGVEQALLTIAGAGIRETVGLEAVSGITGRIPVSVIWGQQDAVITAPDQQSFSDAGIELHLLPGAGHMVMVEAPDEVNRLIRAQLDRRIHQRS
jgi:pyruvate dehydrogenase E2 component (dihydrolipoamide acetyltransferase)